jgi:deoxyribose-phosphate aldolase
VHNDPFLKRRRQINLYKKAEKSRMKIDVPDKGPITTVVGKRNDGLPLDIAFVRSLRVNRSAVERRCSTLGGRRTVKKNHQAAWLIKAVSCMDLTTLSGDDTPARVRRLCAKARQPVSLHVQQQLGVRSLSLHTAAVCVYHEMVATAVKSLEGTGIPVAAVSTGFPAGLTPHRLKVMEIEESVAAGAEEIDIVISRRHVLNADWNALYEEMRDYRRACGTAHVKAILATGELGTLANVARASWVCMMAGADFIKTSTGKESVNASLPITLVMLRTIRDYHDRTGIKVGYKPAGGISKAKDSLSYLALVKEELGNDWLSPELFRFGASSLLGDIERQLEHHLTGSYSSSNRHALA